MLQTLREIENKSIKLKKEFLRLLVQRINEFKYRPAEDDSKCTNSPA